MESVTPARQGSSRHSTVDHQRARASQRRADRGAARDHQAARRSLGKNTSSNAACVPTPNSNANAAANCLPGVDRPV